MPPQLFSDLTTMPWWDVAANAAAVIYLVIRPRHIFGVLIVLIIECVVPVSWFLSFPQLVDLLP